MGPGLSARSFGRMSRACLHNRLAQVQSAKLLWALTYEVSPFPKCLLGGLRFGTTLATTRWSDRSPHALSFCRRAERRGIAADCTGLWRRSRQAQFTLPKMSQMGIAARFQQKRSKPLLSRWLGLGLKEPPTLSPCHLWGFLLAVDAARTTSYPASSLRRPLRLTSAGVRPCDSSHRSKS
jgi:hypothetical protein